MERLLIGVTRNRGQISLYAAPAFIWFSTRLFAGVRTSLNESTMSPPARRRARNFVVNWLAAKLRECGDGLATVVLFLANTGCSRRSGHHLGARSERSSRSSGSSSPRSDGCSASCSRSRSRSPSSTSRIATPRCAGFPGEPRCWPPPSPRCCSSSPSGSTACTSRICLGRRAAGDANVGGGRSLRPLGLLHGHRLSARRRWSPRPGSCAGCSSDNAPFSADRESGGRRASLEVPCRRPVPAIIPILVVATLLGACSSSARRARATTEPLPLAAADLAAIRATDTAFISAVAAGDAAGVAAIYLPDARVLPQNAPRFRGASRPEAMGRVDRCVPAQLDVASDEIEGRGDLAYARGRYTLDGTPKAKGTSPLHDQGKFLRSSAASRTAPGGMPWTCPAPTSRLRSREFPSPGPGYILWVPQVRRAPAREPRQDLAGSSAKRCPVSLRGA